jgi:hypothetical protein
MSKLILVSDATEFLGGAIVARALRAGLGPRLQLLVRAATPEKGWRAWPRTCTCSAPRTRSRQPLGSADAVRGSIPLKMKMRFFQTARRNWLKSGSRRSLG